MHYIMHFVCHAEDARGVCLSSACLALLVFLFCADRITVCFFKYNYYATRCNYILTNAVLKKKIV